VSGLIIGDILSNYSKYNNALTPQNVYPFTDRVEPYTIDRKRDTVFKSSISVLVVLNPTSEKTGS